MDECGDFPLAPTALPQMAGDGTGSDPASLMRGGARWYGRGADGWNRTTVVPALSALCH